MMDSPARTNRTLFAVPELVPFTGAAQLRLPDCGEQGAVSAAFLGSRRFGSGVTASPRVSLARFCGVNDLPVIRAGGAGRTGRPLGQRS